MSVARAVAAAAWAGHELDEDARAQLEAYADWLVDEAIPAGGLGPREADRLWSRHIADSLSFAVAWQSSPGEILDVGSGVGLPGIPLAALWPDTYVTLLDRGGRRTKLLRRVVRILALRRAAVAQADVFAVADEWEGLVFRGSVTGPEAVGLSSKLLAPGGTAVIGLSRRAELPARAKDLAPLATAMGLDTDVVRVPDEILDGPAWLLIMRR